VNRFESLLAEFLDGTLDEASAAELRALIESDPEKLRMLVEMHQQSGALSVELGHPESGASFTRRVLDEVARDKTRFVASVIDVIQQRARQRQRVAMIASLVFALLWLVSALLTSHFKRAYERQQALLDRKKIEALPLHETVPGLKTRALRLRTEIERLKRLLGYGGETDAVLVRAVQLLNGYHDDALADGMQGKRFMCQRGEYVVRMRVAGRWIAVPIIGQRIEPDKLIDVPYLLNLENIVYVLRLLIDRMTLRHSELQKEIALLEKRLEGIHQGHGAKEAVLRKEIAKLERRQDDLQRTRRSITNRLGGQIRTTRQAHARLIGQQRLIDRKIASARALGEKQSEQLRNKIIQLHKSRDNFRRVHGLRRRDRKYRNRYELISSAIEDDRPDGAIVSIDKRGAWINLGRKQGVKPGLIFFACSAARGDFWSHRATLRVIRSEANSSLCRVVEIKQAQLPPAKGDRLFNKVFRVADNPRGPVRVVFIGKFPTSGAKLGQLKQLLTRIGATVEPRLTHRTTLVIVEADYLFDPAFLKATQDLNIEVLTTAQLREFISY